MKVLDAKTAAEEIHAAVENRLHPTAEDRHIVSFVTDVCAELGLEPTAVNVAVVADALREADIQPHLIQHYPKMAVDENGKAILLDPAGKRLPVDARGLSTVEGVVGSHVIFESEDEEKAFGTPKEGDVVKPWTSESHDAAVADHLALNEQGMPRYDSDAAAVHDAQPRAYVRPPLPMREPIPSNRGPLDGELAADKSAAQAADAKYAADIKAKQDAEDVARRGQPKVPA